MSAANDEVDSIYKEEDPIEASIAQRKKRGGRITAVTRDNASRLPNRFFFALSLRSATDEAEKPSKSAAKRTADKSATFSEEQAKKSTAKSRHRRNASMHPADQQDLNPVNVSGSRNQSPGPSPNQSVLLNQTAQQSPLKQLPEPDQQHNSSQKWEVTNADSPVNLAQAADPQKDNQTGSSNGSRSRNQALQNEMENQKIQNTLQEIVDKQEEELKLCSPL